MGVGLETEALAGDAIRQYGRMQTAALLNRLVEHGHDVGAVDPRATLLSRLGRASSLEHAKGIGWQLKEQRHQLEETSGNGFQTAPDVSGLRS